MADLRHDFVQTVNQPLDDLDLPALHAAFAMQLEQGHAALAREKVTVQSVEHHFSADMQFQGQSHVVRVPLAGKSPSAQVLQDAFQKVYWDRFRVDLPQIRARVVNVNCSVIGVCAPVDLSLLIDAAGRLAQATPSGRRAVWFDGAPQDTPVYWRDHLPLDVVLEGPAIIEQLDCTTLIPPGDRVKGGVDGNLTIHIGAAQ